MSDTRETIERLRAELAPAVALFERLPIPAGRMSEVVRHIEALLDIAEAAERLRGEYVTIEPWWVEWEQAEMEYAGFWACRWCDGEAGNGNPDSVRHFDACPALALDRALDALGGE